MPRTAPPRSRVRVKPLMLMPMMMTMMLMLRKLTIMLMLIYSAYGFIPLELRTFLDFFVTFLHKVLAMP